MTINPDKSFEVSEHGITLDSGSGIWVGGGDAVPTFNAPEGSRYFRTSPPEFYVQNGTGINNNWELFDSGSSSGAGLLYTWAGKTSSPGYHYVYNDAPSGGAMSVNDYRTEGTVAKTGTLSTFAWNTKSGTSTTVIKIKKNNIVISTQTLTAASGVISGLGLSVSSGDLIAIMYDSGDVTGEASFNLVIE